ncbi:MAG: hypothetical protein GWN62_34765, partial [Aliifodinibius sp.]|nr:hypothetical protein [Fodinibius sp.]
MDPTQGAITSLLLGSAGSLGGKGFRALRKSVASPLVERGMSPSLSEILSNSQDISNSDAYDRAADNYEDASNENARRWGSVYPLAQQLTDMGVKFDRQSYINSLKKAKRTQSLSKMGIKTPEEKSAASNILDNEIKDAIGTAVDPLTLRSKSKMDTLMDAMDKRQEVNRKARSFYKADGTV